MEVETADIRRKHAGKQAPRPGRSKMSTVRVIDNSATDRPREEDATKEEEKRQKEAARAARGMREAGRGRGTSGSMGWRSDVAIGATEKVCAQCQSTPMFHEISLACGSTLVRHHCSF